MSIPVHRSSQRGFSLIEISIVLIIAGLALGAGLAALGPQIKERRFTQTQSQLNSTADAILGFAMTNGRLPCPATPTSNGLEAFCTTATGGCVQTTDATTAGAQRGRCAAGAAVSVALGYVPARSMGLGDQNPNGVLVDAWAQTVTYAVSAVLANTHPNTAVTFPAGNCSAGVPCYPWTQARGALAAYYDGTSWLPVRLQTETAICAAAAGITATSCNTAPVVATASFVVSSYGSNGAAAAGNASELANTNNDRIYVQLSRTADVPAATYFDDLFAWGTPEKVLQRMIESGAARP